MRESNSKTFYVIFFWFVRININIHLFADFRHFTNTHRRFFIIFLTTIFIFVNGVICFLEIITTISFSVTNYSGTFIFAAFFLRFRKKINSEPIISRINPTPPKATYIQIIIKSSFLHCVSLLFYNISLL